MPDVFVNFHMHSDLHFVANPKATILLCARRARELLPADNAAGSCLIHPFSGIFSGQQFFIASKLEQRCHHLIVKRLINMHLLQPEVMGCD